MSIMGRDPHQKSMLSRRAFLWGLAGASVAAAGGSYLWRTRELPEAPAAVFAARAAGYSADLADIMDRGFKELGVGPEQIKGKTVLLKPNLVETFGHTIHICTHPAVVVAAAQAFLRLGAARVWVGEGSGHCRDTWRVLDETGLSDALAREKLRFIDLNLAQTVDVPNLGQFTKLKTLTLPTVIKQADWVVSMPKMKTHHWAGATVSMKNLFGVMPGAFYGWPKNVLHHQGVANSILDINATVRPEMAIVDGIVGMEGDGPLMGSPKPAGVLVMGRNLAAVDATCCRIMGIDPAKIEYLAVASGRLGAIREENITQRGEAWASLRTDFKLVDFIPAHQGIRL